MRNGFRPQYQYMLVTSGARWTTLHRVQLQVPYRKQ